MGSATLGQMAVVGALFFMLTPVSQAYSGLELLEYCEQPSGSEAAGRCAGYIVGVSDRAFVETGDAEICPRGMVTREQAARQVLNYLKADANRLHQSAAILVVDALVEAYPCSR